VPPKVSGVPPAHSVCRNRYASARRRKNDTVNTLRKQFESRMETRLVEKLTAEYVESSTQITVAKCHTTPNGAGRRGAWCVECAKYCADNRDSHVAHRGRRKKKGANRRRLSARRAGPPRSQLTVSLLSLIDTLGPLGANRTPKKIGREGDRRHRACRFRGHPREEG
jgi:hypothetical protein